MKSKEYISSKKMIVIKNIIKFLGLSPFFIVLNFKRFLAKRN